MLRVFFCLFFCFSVISNIFSQILPKENSHLNYRIIGFSYPTEQAAHSGEYVFEIANGSWDNESDFKKNIAKTIKSDTNRVIGEVPEFGKQYTWRVRYNQPNNPNSKSNFFHFSTLHNDGIDSCATRFRILVPASKHKESYVFLDSYRALYDMHGQPVWFLPGVDGKKIIPRDIKITGWGTITLMLGEDIYEVDYNGNILWKGPNPGVYKDSGKYYHHQFSRLGNGHYMVMGNEPMWLKMPNPADSSFTLISSSVINPDSTDPAYRKVFLTTLLEYDENRNLLWTWRSSSYFNHSDLAYHRTPDNGINSNTHGNAFFFDEQKNEIYISFKGISRIVKIKYPEGKVLNVYGEPFEHNKPEKKNRFFCDQHSCMLSKNGYVYLYNNNVCNPRALSEIVMFSQPSHATDSIQLIWKYKCPIERTSENAGIIYQFPSGGNVIELDDESIFACMGGMYSKVFIVDKDKNVLWSALPEKWNDELHKWEVFSQYRASIITDKKQFEKLIWNTK